MNILIIDNGTKHLGRLKKLLIGNKIDVYKLFSKYPDTNKYNLVILSGGSQISIINAPEIFTQEIQLVKNSTVPIIGICQGCEVIAYTFGSELSYLNRKSKGIKNITLLPPLTKFSKHIDVYEAHNLVISKLGKNLLSYGESKDGIEIIKHKVKNIVGLQFHPEMMVDKTLGDELFRNIFIPKQ